MWTASSISEHFHAWLCTWIVNGGNVLLKNESKGLWRQQAVRFNTSNNTNKLTAIYDMLALNYWNIFSNVFHLCLKEPLYFQHVRGVGSTAEEGAQLHPG